MFVIILTLWRSRSRKSSSPFCAGNRSFLNVLNKSLIVNVSPSRRRLWSLPPDSSIRSRLRPNLRSLRASRSSSDSLSLFRSLVLRPRAFFTLSTSSSTFCNGVRLMFIGEIYGKRNPKSQWSDFVYTYIRTQNGKQNKNSLQVS